MPASASLSIAAVTDQVGGIALPDPVVLVPSLQTALAEMVDPRQSSPRRATPPADRDARVGCATRRRDYAWRAWGRGRDVEQRICFEGSRWEDLWTCC